MLFEFVDEVLKTKLKLKFSDLEVLTTASSAYEILLFQHGGEVLVTNDFIGNNKTNDAINKFRVFFKKAKEENVSLAVTPEYSCPWATIQEIVENENLQPTKEKLWVIGCESITKEQLNEFTNSNQNKNNIIIYFDESVIEKSGKTLLNPLCYIFKALSKDESWTTVLLIQFKTQHCGVWSGKTEPIEKDNLILGKHIFVFRNNAESVNLFTLICSDVEKFKVANFINLPHWPYHPFLVLNIQLNKDPRHRIFLDFKNEVFEHSYHLKEMITLNWADQKKQNYPCSSIYKQTPQFNLDERIIEKNHKKGLYYTYKRSNYHCIFLHSDSYIFKVKNSKLSHIGTASPMARDAGPEVLKIFEWDAHQKIFTENKGDLNDGFLECLEGIKCDLVPLSSKDLNIFYKERLINLVNGKINNELEWYKVNNLISFKINDQEHINRLTFAQDQTTLSQRQRYFDNFRVLKEKILTSKGLLPEFILDCFGDWEILFLEKEGGHIYSYNLITKNRKNAATVAYIGTNDNSSAQEVFATLKKMFLDEQNWRRIVVWFKRQDFEYIHDPRDPSIRDQAGVNPAAITRE